MRTKTVWFFAVLLLAAGGYSEASGIDVASTINNAILNQLPSQNSTASGPSWATFGVVLNGRDAVHQPER